MGTVTLPVDDSVPAEFVMGERARQATEAHEASDLLRAALTAIEPPQRTALELALFSTLTHAEIAERLAQPAGTIKTWIRRGLQELRANLVQFSP